METTNKVGRPPCYETAEQLQLAIDDYFKNGVTRRKIIVGKKPNHELVEIDVPTITGLCFHLGFASRQSFYDYEEKSEFTYTIKRARLYIEKEYEEQLQIGNTTGAIFALKNFGWTDTQFFSHNISSLNEKIQTVYDTLQLEPEIPDSEPEQA